MSGRGGGIAGNPVLIGAATVLVILVAVFLSYNANRACRSCRPTRSRPRCPSAAQPGRRQRGPRSAARASARSATINAQAARRTARAIARARPEAREGRRAAAQGLDACSSARARRSASSTSRSRAGTSSQGFAGRRHDPARAATPTPVEFDEFLNMFDDNTRAAVAGEPRGLRRRVRRPRRVDQHRDRRASARCCATSCRWRRTCPTPEHAPRALRPRARRRPRAIVAPAAETQASLFVNLDTTFARAARGRAAVHPGLDHRAAGPRSTRRSASFPLQRPFLRNTRGRCSASCGPASARCAPRRPALADALGDRHAGAAQDAAAQPPPRRRCCRSCRTFADDPLVPRGIQATDRRWSSRCNPTLDYLAPAQTAVQLRDAVVPQRLLAAERGRPQRHLAALHHRRHAAGPEQRGRPVLGARQRPDASTTTCTPTRTRTRRRRASRRSARPATSRTSRQDRDRQRARHAAGDDGGQRQVMAAPPQAALARVAIGLIAPPWSSLIVLFLGFTKDIPFTRGFEVKAVVRVGELDPARTRPCGSPASRSARSSRSRPPRAPNAAVVTMEINKNGAADPRGRDGQDPAAHLPRGQLLRRPQAGHAAAPEAAGRRHDQDHPDGVAGAARRGADVAAERLAPGPQGRCSTGSRRRSTPSRRPRRTPTPTRRARPDRRRSPSTTRYDDIPAAERSTAQVFEALLGTEPERDVVAPDRAARRDHRRRLIRNESALKDLITNFNTTMAAFASRVGQPARVDPPAARRRSQNANARLRLAQRRVPADARVRARDPARRARDAGDDRRRVPVDRADPQARLASRSSAAWPRSSRPPPPTSRALIDRAIELLPQTDLASKCVARRRAPDRRPRHQRRVRRPARRTTRSSSTRWSGSPARARTSTATACTCASRPAAARRRSRSAQALEHRPAVRQQRRRAARQPAGLSRASARRTSPTCPATRRSCRTSTARRRRSRRRATARTTPRRSPTRDSRARPTLPLPRAQAAPVRPEALRGGAGQVRPRSASTCRTSSRSSALLVVALRRVDVILGQPAPARCRRGCRSSARTSSRSTPRCRPRRPSRRARARRSTSPASRWARSRASSWRRQGDHRPEDRAASTRRIYKDATRAAAAQDRPEGHGRRAHARARRTRAGCPRAARSRSRRRCPTSTSTRSSPSLDADTRDYLRLLLNDGGAGAAAATAASWRRRSGASSRPRSTRARSTRRWPSGAANIARVVHNFSLLTDELGQRDTQLASFVVNSNAVFAALARQDASAAADAAQAAAHAERHADDARQGHRRMADDARADAAGAAARRPGARPVAARRCARSCARRRRSSATSSGRSRAPRCRRSSELRPALQRPRGGDARPHARLQGRQLAAQQGRLQPARRHEEGYLFWSSWVNHARPDGLLDPGRARPDPPRPRRAVGCQTGAAAGLRRRRPTRSSARSSSCSNAPATDADLPEVERRPAGGRRWSRPLPASASIAAMVIFALSCFGLLLFLWLAFGGPVPLKPKGYRFTASASPRRRSWRKEADVRISGVPVGKVKTIDARQADRARRRRRSSSSRGTRRCRRTRRRSCARRRCWARPTSS